MAAVDEQPERKRRCFDRRLASRASHCGARQSMSTLHHARFSWKLLTASSTALTSVSLSPTTSSPISPPTHPPCAFTMPSANTHLAPHRAEQDDGHDQIGSNSSTPPGAATPRPDPADKRLPGILHSYFGQVRDSLLPRRKSSAVNPSPASASESAPDRTQATQEKENDPSRLRSSTLPSPTPSASSASRHPSTSQLNGQVEKLTQGDFAPPQNQATPPQTPRTRSTEGKPRTSNLSQTSLGSRSRSKDSSGPAVGPPKGKLALTISEGRGLRPSIDPYVVCQFQWAEYISDGPRNEGAPTRPSEGLNRNTSGLAIRRTDSDMGKPMAIPMRSRQSSNSGTSSDPRENGTFKEVTNPKWEHDAILYVHSSAYCYHLLTTSSDVVGDHSEIDISVYDRSNGEAFLGHVRFCPNLVEYEHPYDGWFTLEPREGEQEEFVTGEIHLRLNFHKTDKKHYGPEDFEILKLIGKGTFGQVFQVRKRDTKRIYAMKVLSKKVIVQKKEVAHTLGERNILVRTAMTESPFIVGLKFSFQTPTDLYLVTDYMSGGELFWHLQREGRFNETRAKFYIAELILALQHLHEHNIVYRDLKPESTLR